MLDTASLCVFLCVSAFNVVGNESGVCTPDSKKMLNGVVGLGYF